MRLTVGPLPAAVYWRRRLLVLGVLVLIVVGIIYACTRGSDTGEQLNADPASQTSTSPSPTTSPMMSPTTSPSPTATPTPTAFTLPVTFPTSGPCSNDEIELTASASQTTLVVGQGATFTLTIKNISNRSCVRDIGSIPQELQLLRDDGTIAWSSDDCRRDDKFSDYNLNETLEPGTVKTFDIYWNGYRSRTGNDTKECTPSDQTKPDAGTYSLVARLDTKFSQPVSVAIRTSSPA